jgi:hypothetical protein
MQNAIKRYVHSLARLIAASPGRRPAFIVPQRGFDATPNVGFRFRREEAKARTAGGAVISTGRVIGETPKGERVVDFRVAARRSVHP